MLTGRVLLTGSGFLVRGLLRRAAREDWPWQPTVYSRSAASQAQCKRRYPRARYVLGDVRDTDRLALVALGYNTIIHTAALKHIPEGELNASECLSVNVSGTDSVLNAAQQAQVERCLFISTDKACLPVNVYGLTKALGERLMMEMASYKTVLYTGVRYGNVIGSSGSVVPEFMAQAERQGYVTVTDPEMTRFWITIDDAIDLILTALSDNLRNGSLLIPEPKSMQLDALVEAILPDVVVNVVGARPGEKMHEQLLTASESLWTVDCDRGYELLGVHNRVTPHKVPFDLLSDDAERMSADEFRAAVVDAQTV